MGGIQLFPAITTSGGDGSTYTGSADRITVTGTVIDIAASYVGQSSITTLGTIGTGVWNGTVITGQYGGTGVANTGKTITLGGNLVTTGAFNLTLAVPQSTTYTLPNTSNETLAGLGTAQTFTAKQTFTAASTEAASLTLLDTTYKTAIDVSAANTLRIGSGFTFLQMPFFTSQSTSSVTCPNTATFTTASGNAAFIFTMGSGSGGFRVTKNSALSVTTTGDFFSVECSSGITSSSTAVINGIKFIPVVNNIAGTITINSFNVAPTMTNLNTGGVIYGYRSQLAASPTGGGTAWNIYADGTAGNYFGGDVTIQDKNLILGTTTGTKIGTATSQKVGLWNATPIVQPTTGVAASTFTANSGTAVNDASTFDGYTLGQVVKALRNMGALA